MTPLRLDDEPKPFLKRLVLHRILPLAGVFGLIIGATWFIKQDYLGQWTGMAKQAAIDLSADAGFKVNQIYVRGRKRADKGALLALINIRRGDPIFQTDPEAAAKSLEKMHWVDQATVTRRLPDEIHINLVERQALALYQHQKKLRLIDRSGNIIPDQEISQFAHLPMVIGPSAHEQAPDLFTLLSAQPSVLNQLDNAIWIGGRRWNLHLTNGITIKLPETGAELALARYVKLSDQPQFQSDDIAVVDLRYPDKAVITQREPDNSGASS